MIKNRLLRKTLRFILKKPLVGLARLHLTKVEYPLDIHSTTNSLKILHAYELLDKYIKQKPEIDNNDVLKTYQKAKKDNPKLAEEIMESKLKQLEPIHSPEGLSERNKVGAKKKNRTSRNKP